MLKTPPESIVVLRHRYARAVEIWAAYQVFLLRQINVGPDMICYDEQRAKQITNTMMVNYYSFVYSLFDSEACHFIDDTEEVIPNSSSLAIEARTEIIALWQKVQNQLKRIRHNTGFHGGKSLKSLKDGYNQLNRDDFHPLVPDCILQYMRVYFRELEFAYDFEEGFMTIQDPAYSQTIMEGANQLRDSIDTGELAWYFELLRNPPEGSQH